jgi:hypothetical protein
VAQQLVDALPGREVVVRKLKELEEPVAASPAGSTMVHILIVAKPNRSTTWSHQDGKLAFCHQAT